MARGCARSASRCRTVLRAGCSSRVRAGAEGCHAPTRSGSTPGRARRPRVGSTCRPGRRVAERGTLRAAGARGGERSAPLRRSPQACARFEGSTPGRVHGPPGRPRGGSGVRLPRVLAGRSGVGKLAAPRRRRDADRADPALCRGRGLRATRGPGRRSGSQALRASGGGNPRPRPGRGREAAPCRAAAGSSRSLRGHEEGDRGSPGLAQGHLQARGPGALRHLAGHSGRIQDFDTPSYSNSACSFASSRVLCHVSVTLCHSSSHPKR